MIRTSEKRTEIERLYQSLADSDEKSAVSVILKLRGETCDIDCLGCYESARRYWEERGSA